jgi:peptidoglycan/xylan/chitin deacetylase (PgdA/CDA1 family)
MLAVACRTLTDLVDFGIVRPYSELGPRGMRTPIRKKIKGAIGRVAGSTGVLARRFRSKMIIVAFHRVSDALPEDGLTHSSAKFEKYCEFFRTHFKVISLLEQVAGCNGPNDLGGTLSITLDDGYRDNFEVAAPILRQLNLPATFFVTTGFIGTQIVAPWDRHLVRQPGWMDWNQVRSLATQGFEIGCHTNSHIDLGTADAETAWSELEVSKRKLHEQLGRPVQLFAYPFGGRNNISERSLKLVREAGFICCLSCFGGVNSSTVSPFELNRIPIARGFGDPDQFGFDLTFGRVADV